MRVSGSSDGDVQRNIDPGVLPRNILGRSHTFIHWFLTSRRPSARCGLHRGTGVSLMRARHVKDALLGRA